MLFINKLCRFGLYIGYGIFGLTIITGSANAGSNVINGATCLPFTTESNTDYTRVHHTLFAKSGAVSCHIDVHSDESIDKLFAVIVTGEASRRGAVKAQLCTYSAGAHVSKCGDDRSLGGDIKSTHLYPPDAENQIGAFVLISFDGLRNSEAARILHLSPIFF